MCAKEMIIKYTVVCQAPWERLNDSMLKRMFRYNSVYLVIGTNAS